MSPKRGSWLWKVGCWLGLLCPHMWRPARLLRTPARLCNLCARVERLSEAEFYSYFGVTSVELKNNLRNPTMRARP